MVLPDELDRLEKTPRPLIDLCDEVESYLLAAVAEELQRIVERSARESEQLFSILTPTRFAFDTRLYDVRVADDATDPTTLHVAIISVEEPTRLQSFKSQIFPIVGRGRYTAISLEVDSSFAELQDDIGAAASCVLAQGYKWLEAHVMRLLLKIEHTVCADLYTEVRKVIPEQLVSLVGLYALAGDHALYVLDPLAVHDYLTRASRRELPFRESPIELAATLVTTVLETNQTVSRHAVATGQTIDTDIRDAPYAATGFNLVERLLYETDADVIQPLVERRRIALVACYPQQIRADVEPILETRKARFADILRREERSVERRLLGATQGPGHRRAVSAVVVAELVGRAIGGFVDALGE